MKTVFFILGNRYGKSAWEMLYSTPFSTIEEAQKMAAKMPKSWHAIIVSTINNDLI